MNEFLDHAKKYTGTARSWVSIRDGGPGLLPVLMVAFTVLAVVPVMTVSTISYTKLRMNEIRNLERALDTVLTYKNREIGTYVNLLLTESRLQAMLLGTRLYSGSTLSQEVPFDSVMKRMPVNELRSMVRSLPSLNRMVKTDVVDRLLISSSGDILYSESMAIVDGMNIYNSVYFGNAIQTANRKAVLTGGPAIADYDGYQERPGERVFAFAIAPVKAPDDRVIGTLALKFNNSGLNRLVHGVSQEYHVDLYMIDRKNRPRAGFGRGDDYPPAAMELKTDMTRKIDALRLRDSEVGDGFAEDSVNGFVYIGPRGGEVFGMSQQVVAEGMDYSLIAEVDSHDVFFASNPTKALIVVITGLALVTGILGAFLFSRLIGPQVMKLARWAEDVADGHLELKTIKPYIREISLVAGRFSVLVMSLKTAVRFAESIAVGSYTESIELRSERDVLGRALKGLSESLYTATSALECVAGGDFDIRLTERSRDDLLMTSVNSLALKLKTTHEQNEKQDFLKTLQAELNEIIRGEHTIDELTRKVLSFLCNSLGAGAGAFYVADGEDDGLSLYSSYAFDRRKRLINSIRKGEGVAGQAIMEKRSIILGNCPDDYMIVQSASGSSRPVTIYAYPLVHGDEISGVLEFGLLRDITKRDEEFLDLVSESVSIAIISALSRSKMAALLSQTVKQAEDLRTHQESLNKTNQDLEKKTEELLETESQLRIQEAELREANEDLKRQTQKLKASEARLRSQEEELRAANEELEARSLFLEQQKNAINEKNRDLEKAQTELIEKSNKLELSSQYKSEFLANMSHELRTPLNSILLISRLLYENRDGNLNDKQQQLAKTVYSSGADLLTLINEVLDLAKIESGKLKIQIERSRIREIEEKIFDSFSNLADEKGVELVVSFNDAVPEYLYVDMLRLEQVLKNLVSNALKFTTEGSVELSAFMPETLPDDLKEDYQKGEVIAFAVEDTGTGIPEEKKEMIFEAFQQADGTISRQYGGTGLGLSISRELAQLMGGLLTLDSVEGKGSTFTLYLPVIEGAVTDAFRQQPLTEALVYPESMWAKRPPASGRDRHQGAEGDSYFNGQKIIIVDDDMRNVYALMSALDDEDLHILVGKNGREALSLLEDNPDTSLVFMDIMMPEMNGFETITQIRSNKAHETLPIIALTAKAMKGDHKKCLDAGATAYLSKPVNIDRLRALMRQLICGETGT